MKKKLTIIGMKAKKALLNSVSTKNKNKVLLKFYELLKKNKDKILVENKKDIKFAKKKGIKDNLINRLELSENKITAMISSVINIAKLEDPTYQTLSKWKRSNGLNFKKVTIPIGVIGVIYDSRPNVTADVSCLCFKSGNSVILRGGSEAFSSNKIISDLFRKALSINKINKNYVQFIDLRERYVVDFMLSSMKNFIDVIIPRGGKGLVKKVQDVSKIPIIGHLEGVCHTYIDKNANINMAKKIVLNAKLRNTSICGATETLLVHKNLDKRSINKILSALEINNCKIYADNLTRKLYKGKSYKANKNFWGKEFLSSKISVKSVKNIDEAINHINKYGTMHTDAIISKNKKIVEKFLQNVNSSIVIHNSSTQFADGGEFGFGGEVGISTNKLPPRGPVGLNQLVTYKYMILGTGQLRK